MAVIPTGKRSAQSQREGTKRNERHGKTATAIDKGFATGAYQRRIEYKPSSMELLRREWAADQHVRRRRLKPRRPWQPTGRQWKRFYKAQQRAKRTMEREGME